MRPLEPPSLAAIREAAERLKGTVRRTETVKLRADLPRTVHLKLELQQPIRSFKLRGATNAMMLADPQALAQGVTTASAGNMAQGVAWAAKRMGVPCRVVVPEHAPKMKLAAVKALGASIIKVPFDRWWQSLVELRFDEHDGHFIHPVSDPDVIAGNGTVGLEILEDVPQADTILVPFGGGGLSSGIASAVRAVKPGVKVYACEVEAAAPLRASLELGRAMTIERRPSFVDGIGGKSVLNEMWPMVSTLLAGSLVVSLDQTVDALRTLIEKHRIVAEGAGAVSVAAAMAGLAPGRSVVCVVSGGNIDLETIAGLLEPDVPAGLAEMLATEQL